MNNDFFDSFKIQYGKKESIIGGKTYNFGQFACEVLELDWEILKDAGKAVAVFQEEFNIYLCSGSATSAARANETLLNLWARIRELPLYNIISKEDRRIENLISHMKFHPQEVADMTKVGTERKQMLEKWLEKIQKLVPSLENFQVTTKRMLDYYYEDLPSRSAEEYAIAYAKYKQDVGNSYDLAEQIEEETSQLDRIQYDFPLSVSYKTTRNPADGKAFLAEEISFSSLDSFLQTDLMKGLAVGNAPRKCHNCNKYFLSIGAYDTVYCQRIAPNETEKTCRQVGAHHKAKAKNGGTFIDKEYYKCYNRLKSRKNRGSIDTKHWNQQVAKAQNLKDKAKQGKLPDADYKSASESL